MSIAKGQDFEASILLISTPEVQQVLRDAGISYFSRTQNFLGWLQSQ